MLIVFSKDILKMKKEVADIDVGKSLRALRFFDLWLPIFMEDGMEDTPLFKSMYCHSRGLLDTLIWATVFVLYLRFEKKDRIDNQQFLFATQLCAQEQVDTEALEVSMFVIRWWICLVLIFF